MNVATATEHSALAKRVTILETRAERTGSRWMPVTKSPLGGRKCGRLIAAGKLKASRVGRRLYVEIEDHDRFLEARLVTPPPPKPVAVACEDGAVWAAANMHLLRGGRASGG